MTKNYDFGDLGVYRDPMPTLAEQVYEHKVETYKRMYDSQINKMISDSLKHNPATLTINTAANPTPSYNWVTSINYDTYQISPQVSKTDCKVEVRMDDDSVEHVTREELIKYIGERKLIRENEVVRTMYDRFQVAAKLARSDDNGDTGV